MDLHIRWIIVDACKVKCMKHHQLNQITSHNQPKAFSLMLFFSLKVIYTHTYAHLYILGCIHPYTYCIYYFCIHPLSTVEFSLMFKSYLVLQTISKRKSSSLPHPSEIAGRESTCSHNLSPCNNCIRLYSVTCSLNSQFLSHKWKQ